jgi:hypothetical protein
VGFEGMALGPALPGKRFEGSCEERVLGRPAMVKKMIL